MVTTEVRPAAAVESAPAKAPFLTRTGRFVLGVALAAAAVYAQSLAMPFEQKGSFLTRHGSVGQIVSADRFNARVSKVTAAKAVDTRDVSGKTAKVQTSHVFLVLDVSGTVDKEPLKLGSFDVWLHSGDGRRYLATDKVDSSLTLVGRWLQAGWWISGPLVFEVPKEALAGAKLVITTPSSAFVEDTFAPEAEIDLGLSDAAAAKLAAEAQEFHSLVGAGS
ncbi:hypothetical protein GCM10009555_060310 [Acrocarpospora macrocephala]|uniref:DUF4352 domain-containing protein n=1 Tax=Acrocarpospora macrocephala TaxID=150177 RepID=A0A5M3WU07_9ACTN|nr:DUF4352 domain-containing protein [Acrocarpospora macrocephala]GES10103.1 hypothetical protein Amac_037000 [Acrocarpospora macrocephala]